MNRRDARALANLIMRRANDGYHNQTKSGYPPFAMTPWEDRRRWSEYIERVAEEVLVEHGRPAKEDRDA